jgi:hypothetical protein
VSVSVLAKVLESAVDHLEEIEQRLGDLETTGLLDQRTLDSQMFLARRIAGLAEEQLENLPPEPTQAQLRAAFIRSHPKVGAFGLVKGETK